MVVVVALSTLGCSTNISILTDAGHRLFCHFVYLVI